MLQQTIIYTCWRVSQCWLSEILLTRLAQGYTTKGRGFSHYQAGLSNYGAYRQLSLEDWHRVHQAVDVDRIEETLQAESDTVKRQQAEIQSTFESSRVFTNNEAQATVLQAMVTCTGTLSEIVHRELTEDQDVVMSNR